MPQDIRFYDDGKGNVRQVAADKIDRFKSLFPDAKEAGENQLSEIESKRANDNEQQRLESSDINVSVPTVQKVDLSLSDNQNPFSRKGMKGAIDISNAHHRSDPDVQFRAKYGAYKDNPELHRDEDAPEMVERRKKQPWYSYIGGGNAVVNATKQNQYGEENKEPATQTRQSQDYLETRTNKADKHKEKDLLSDFLTNTQSGRDAVEYDKNVTKYFEELKPIVEKQRIALQQQVNDVNEKRKIYGRNARAAYLIISDEQKKEQDPSYIPTWDRKLDVERAQQEYKKNYEALVALPEPNDIMKAQEALTSLKNMKEALNDRDKSAVQQYIGEIKRNASKELVDAITFGTKGMIEDMAGVKGGPLTDKVMETTQMFADINENLMKDQRSLAQDIALGSLQNAGFILQMGLTSGIAKGIVGAGGKVLSKLFSPTTKAIARRVAFETGGKVVSVAGREISEVFVQAFLMPSTLASALERNAANPGHFLDSWAAAYKSTLVEVGSERIGDFIPMGKFKSPLVNKVMQATHLNNIPVEFLEEQIGTLGHIALGTGEGKWSDFTDKRNQLVTLGVVTSSGMPYMAIESGGYAAGKYQVVKQKYEIGKSYKNNVKEMQAEFGEEADDIMSVIESSMESMKDDLAAIQTLTLAIANTEGLNKEQQNTVFTFAMAATAKKGLERAKQEAKESAKQANAETLKGYVNESTGTVTLVNVAGMDAPVAVQGDIVFTEDGKIDTHNSGVLYYTDNDGKKQVVNPQFVDLVESTPAEQVEEALNQTSEQEIENEYANDEVRAYEAGEVIRYAVNEQQSIVGTIQGVDNNGNYIVYVDGFGEATIEPRMIVPEDNLKGVQNGSMVEYTNDKGEIVVGEVQDMISLRNAGLVMIDGKEVPTQNIIGIEGTTEAENATIEEEATQQEAEETEVTPVTPEQQAEKEKETFIQALPVNNKGEIDQKQMTTAQTMQYFEYQYGVDETLKAAEQQIKNKEGQLKAAQTRLNSDPFNIAKREKVSEIQSELEEYKAYVFDKKKAKAQEIAVTSTSSIAEEQAKQERERTEAEAQRQAEQADIEALKGIPDVTVDKAKDARARGYRSVNGEMVNRQEAVTPTAFTEAQRKFSDKESVPVKRTIVEAETLQPSHKNGVKNDSFFITEAQPKPRTDDASQHAAESIASNINPQEITGGVTAYTGAPIVNSHGEVIQGNNRVTGLQLMHESRKEQAEKYKQHLKENAGDYGMTAEQVDAMTNPVAVDVAEVSDADAIRLGQLAQQDTESGGIQRVPAKQTSVALGDNMGRFAQILFESTNEDAISTVIEKNGRKAIDYLRQKGVINPTQYQSAFDKDGNITPEAKKDLQDIASQMLFEGANENIEQMFDALPDKAQKAILQTIHRDAKSPKSERIVKELQQAIEAYYHLQGHDGFANATDYKSATIAARAAKNSTVMFNSQSDLPLQKYSNFAMEMAVLFKTDTQKELRQRFNSLYDNIQGVGGDVFNAAEKLSLVEAIKKHFNNIDYVSDGQTKRTDVAGDSKTSGKGRQEGAGEAASGERTETGGKPTDSGAGTNTDNKQSGKTNPNLTQEREITKAIQELSAKLNTPFTIYNSAKEIPESEHKARQSKAKAWYIPSTGEVFINAFNATSVQDVRVSIFHEVVAHKGMRDMLGKEKHAELMNSIFDALPKQIQDALLEKYKSKEIAADEYVAYLAENEKNLTPQEKGTWESIKQAIIDFIENHIGIKLTEQNVDDVIRGLLVESKKRLENKGKPVNLVEVAKESVEKNKQQQKERKKLVETKNKTKFVGNEQQGNRDKTRLDNTEAVGSSTISGLVGEQQKSSAINRTVEASNNAGSENAVITIEEREELESRGINPDWNRPKFLQNLKEQAKKNGVWLDESFLDNQTLIHDQKTTGTAENDLYLSPDGKTITKVNNLSYVNSGEKAHNLNAFIDRLTTHNELFPDVAYNIIGFAENKHGQPSIVLQQSFIEAERNATAEEINAFLTDKGFEKAGVRTWSNNHEVWSNGTHEIFDARPANVLIDKGGNLRFIDTYPHSVVYMDSEAKSKATQKIEDFGEVIEGAKKHTYQRIETTETDMQSQPLSKTFPKPNYSKLIGDGALTKKGAMVLKHAYEALPSKPRKKFRVAAWMKEVEKLIATYNSMIETKEFGDSLHDKLVKQDSFDSDYADFVEIQEAFGFPENDVNMGAYRVIPPNRTQRSTGIDKQWLIVKGNSIYGKADSAEGIARVFNQMVDKNKKKGVALSIYRDTKTNKYFIGRKTGGGIARLVEGLTREEVARMYKEDMPKLQEMWEARKVKPDERRKENRKRVGTDYRKGKDVTPEQFGEAFGFRGVQFGNWLNSAERQEALNDAYDAFMDLSNAIGVSPRALSLAGELGMAFGARGSGNAMAHYESGKVVINLTKTKGAGSLAHEWWHAMDSYFSRMRGEKQGFLTESPRQKYKTDGGKRVLDTSIRTEMHEAFLEVMNAINNSDLPKRSKELDKSRSNAYWATQLEMSARAFEGYIIDKLGETGEQNDYLANFKEIGEWVKSSSFDMSNYPYPTINENASINEAFESLFDAMQEKEEDGKTILYRETTETPAFKKWFGDWGANQSIVKIDNNRLIIDGKDVGLIEHSDKGAYIEIEKLYIDKDKQKQGNGKKAIAHLANKYGKEIKLYPLEAAPFLNMGVKRMDGEMFVLDTDKYNSSKVVNEEGEPLVVYHGTTKDFNTFDLDKTGRSTDSGMWGKGFYFSNNPSYSHTYSKRDSKDGAIMPVFLSLKNPYVIESKKDIPNIEVPDATIEDLVNGANNYSEKFREHLIDKGHDGVIVQFSGDSKIEYVAFNPNQIKSATDNIGTFDVANDDIRYRETDRPQFSDAIETVVERFVDRVTLKENEFQKEAPNLKELVLSNDVKDYGLYDKYEVVPVAEPVVNIHNLNRSIYGLGIELYALDYLKSRALLDFDGDTGKLNAEKVEQFSKEFEGAIQPYETALLKAKHFATEAAQREIMDIIKDIDHAKDYYGRLAKDHNVLRSEDAPRFRDAESISELADMVGSDMTEEARKEYDKKYNSFASRFREAWEDSYIPVKQFQDLLEKNGVKIEEHNDYYKQATHVPGKNDFQLEHYKETYQHPITLAVNALQEKGFTYREIENYVFAKHGIERNEFMRRDEAKNYANAIRQRAEIKAMQEQRSIDNKLSNDAIDVSEHEKQTNRIERAKQKKLKESDAVEERKYQELQDKDYAGLTQLMEEINPEGVDQGRTLQEMAEEYNKDFEGKAGEKLINSLWGKIKKATDFTLDNHYKTGGVSRDVYLELKGRYQNFVPLRGHDQEVAEDRWHYTQGNMGEFYSGAIIKAQGRRSRAESPFAYIGQMAHSSIMRGNKNTLNQTLLRLAHKDKSGLMDVKRTWYVNKGTLENPMWEAEAAEFSDNIDTYLQNQIDFEERMKEMQEIGMAAQSSKHLNIGGLFIKPKQAEQHEIQVDQNGVHYTIYINANPAIARSINGDNKKSIAKDMGFIGNVTRAMAMNFTTRNPLFIARNFSRDYIFANTMLMVKEDATYTARFNKNMPLAFAALTRQKRGNLDLKNETDLHLYEFMMNGGRTGFSHIFELKRAAKALEKEARKGDSKSALDYGRAALGAIDVVNDVVENATRLSTYMASRQAGRSITQSVHDAKNVTVNFNQKGAGSSIGNNSFERFILSAAGWVRPLYLFTNAAVQALSNVGKATKKHPVKMGVAVTSFALMGFLSPIIAGMIGGDDEEEDFMKMSDWDRQNNWCIPVGSGYIKIPLPHEMRVFHRLGDNIYQASTGRKDTLETMLDMMFALSDLVPMNPMGAADASWAELTPDFAKPYTQHITNTSFMGTRIHNQWANPNAPGYTKVNTNKKGEAYAPAFLIELYKHLDHITGGDGVKKGVVSLNPDVTNHYMRGWFGGLWTIAEQSIDIGYKATEWSKTGELNLKVRETPLSSFYTNKNDLNVSSGSTGQRYYNIMKDVNEARRRSKGYVKKVREGEMSIQEHADKVKALDMGKVNILYDRIKEIKDMEARLKDLDGKEQKDLEKEIFEKKKMVVEMK